MNTRIEIMNSAIIVYIFSNQSMNLKNSTKAITPAKYIMNVSMRTNF